MTQALTVKLLGRALFLCAAALLAACDGPKQNPVRPEQATASSSSVRVSGSVGVGVDW